MSAVIDVRWRIGTRATTTCTCVEEVVEDFPLLVRFAVSA
jgi:hypothetical protein